MKKEKLGALVFWASLLVLAVCAFLLAGRPTLIPTGIPGDAVAFGMGAEEVAQTAGRTGRARRTVCAQAFFCIIISGRCWAAPPP